MDRGAASPVAPSSPVADGGDLNGWRAPCAAGSAEHKAASLQIDDLGQAIHDLPMKGDPKPLASRLEALRGSPCLAVGDLEGAQAAFDSALALKTFWESGGREWLSAPLHWHRATARTYWNAPSARRSLTQESAAAHVLRPLLCPALPGACGADTKGWALRAGRAFHAHALAQRALRVDADPEAEPPKTHASCSELSLRVASDDAFSTFVSCIEEIPLAEDALPLGSFRAPRDGWLVIRGSRGHHSRCEELRAYDLETGAAYVVSACGGPTGQGAPLRTVVGKLSVDALREAAWMMMLSEVAQPSVVASEGLAIPDDIPIQTRPGGGGVRLGTISTSSGRTTLVYQWVRGGKSVATGTVDWPDASTAARHHATELLAIAEAAMRPGCAPKTLPPIPWNARSDAPTRIRPAGYFPAYDTQTYQLLEQEIEKVGRARSNCP